MCELGDTIEVPVNDRPEDIDKCIVKQVLAINKDGIYKTLGCCCGHGKHPKTIIVMDKNGVIFDYCSGMHVPRKRCFYKRDSDGVYYLPENMGMYCPQCGGELGDGAYYEHLNKFSGHERKTWQCKKCRIVINKIHKRRITVERR